MLQDENLQIVREAFDAWNAHDPNQLAKLLDEKYVAESDTLREPIIGREAGRQVMQMYIRAFPDLHLAVDQMIASGDDVVTRWTATGTHRGELMGIAATNQPAVTHGCSVFELRSGKLVREWVYWDTGHLLRQLGVLPRQAPTRVPS